MNYMLIMTQYQNPFTDGGLDFLSQMALNVEEQMRLLMLHLVIYIYMAFADSPFVNSNSVQPVPTPDNSSLDSISYLV